MNDVAEYANGRLKGFNFVISQILTIGDRLEELAVILGGYALQSPKIRSTEEAKYQRGTVIYQNNIIELMDEEQALSKRFEELKREYREFSNFLQKLDDSEVELLQLRYEKGFRYEVIAKILYTNQGNIYRRLEKILEKWEK